MKLYTLLFLLTCSCLPVKKVKKEEFKLEFIFQKSGLEIVNKPLDQNAFVLDQIQVSCASDSVDFKLSKHIYYTARDTLNSVHRKFGVEVYETKDLIHIKKTYEHIKCFLQSKMDKINYETCVDPKMIAMISFFCVDKKIIIIEAFRLQDVPFLDEIEKRLKEIVKVNYPDEFFDSYHLR